MKPQQQMAEKARLSLINDTGTSSFCKVLVDAGRQVNEDRWVPTRHPCYVPPYGDITTQKWVDGTDFKARRWCHHQKRQYWKRRCDQQYRQFWRSIHQLEQHWERRGVTTGTSITKTGAIKSISHKSELVKSPAAWRKCEALWAKWRKWNPGCR